MKNKELDLYTDYLLSTFGAATATGLSAMVGGAVSHDQVTRFLSKTDYTSKDLWLQVKSVVRSIERDEGVLIFDDTIQEKAWTDENELMCWHYDHVSGRNVRGINLLNALYHAGGASIPVAFELIKKPLQYCDVQTRQIKRMSEVTKNELMRQMIQTCLQNSVKFRYVLMDSWFSASENFEFIRSRDKNFVAALKDNRLIALTEQDRKAKRFTRVDELNFPEQGCVRGYLKGYGHEVLLVRQVFTHKDGSKATLHLVCSDLSGDYNAITTTYKKRWAVEVFHKSLKSNASLAKSPTRTVRTQSNHVFMTICAAFKLECLSIKTQKNPFALCRKLLINASRAAYDQLQLLLAATA
ncbi:transposase [Chitinimonas sp. BJB300]|uniref:IS701 family transposase n=1 Tax=Chitinimonas sp. BJB300 TaxID=1559339 RepID=UPI0011125963|nr:transposase [Chitinimonas sp. BJB300]TSJ83839.1 transposase [Chitinimonas sp. BJB300]